MAGGLPAARQGDLSSHGGLLQGSCTTVHVEGCAPYLTNDIHICPQTGHPALPAPSNASKVLVEGRSWLCLSDTLACTGPCSILTGALTVFIGSPEQTSDPAPEPVHDEYPFSR